MTNFTDCALRYINNETAIALYNYSGPVTGIPANISTQIRLDGCRAICGTGNDLYPWSTSSATITTWILPILGILLQAPFESNAFWRTAGAITRWIGSPISSLSYILWNISVTGKAALMVDMALPYDEQLPGEGSDWARMRDSFYVLSNMNQYTMNIKPAGEEKHQKAAEAILRIVLFSRDLKLKGTHEKLQDARETLASRLREGRKRGVVPVFISTMWFIFSLAISIQSAFGLIGSNSQAHDLALGLLLSWLPVLILCSIVDRNPVAADDIRRRLNKLIGLVCDALLDEQNLEDFINTFNRRTKEGREMEARVRNSVLLQAEAMRWRFFEGFAGQGRVRWHYGAAHPILCDIEDRYVAKHGRYWIRNETEARTYLVLGAVDKGLLWLDLRELWQVATATIIVSCSCLGAFILSFFTPTVGLGCRSGGYTIFCVTAFGLLTLEILVWWISSMAEPNTMKERTQSLLRRFGRFMLPYVTFAGALALRAFLVMVSWIPFEDKERRLEKFKTHSRRRLNHLDDCDLRWWTERFFFRPVEWFNAAYLTYIVLAQTFGGFVNCECQSSTWASGGGYIDLTQWDFTHVEYVQNYWKAGTVLSSTVLGLSLTYVVIEWCIQSHLSTANYEDACRGLRRTRRFRVISYPFRYPYYLFVRAINSPQHVLAIIRRKGTPKNLYRTLIWTRHTKQPAFPRTNTAMTELSDMDYMSSPEHRPSDVMDNIPMIIEPANPEQAHAFRRPDTSGESDFRSSSDASRDSSPTRSDFGLLPGPAYTRVRSDSTGSSSGSGLRPSIG
ncbi:hypothetical protein K402DRAFT_359520 [Aulographum hederae CBS 113979]|uniref:Uncharacterized protein n=1 Tax=Aulographum hederae CBS 113979 TaxID=1176131 RepID=A0A6G1GTU1_9PEZI|nr:hypothetical protein K402DRAFT_359520 [Aulographum hederae CBS 113979]